MGTPSSLLSTEFMTQKTQDHRYARRLGDLINNGTYTLEEAVARISSPDTTPESVLASIDIMFKNGMLDDEPSPGYSTKVD